MAGKFITLEGGEGVGKTTQSELIVENLRKLGVRAIKTREPGGTPGADEIRRLLVTGEAGRWDGVTELMLFFAARRDHVEKLIKPALAAGTWVVCDRFADSTFAYQCYGRKEVRLALALVQYEIALGRFAPDLSVLLDADPASGPLAKAREREGNEKRFERMDEEFHIRVAAGFRRLAKKFAARYETVAASGAIAQVNAEIMRLIAKRFFGQRRLPAELGK